MSKREKSPDIANLLGGGKAKVEEQAPAPESKPELPSKQGIQGKQGIQSLPGKPTAQAGLPDGWTRATFIVRETNLEQLKALAYYHRRPLKDILEEALARYLKREKTEEALETYDKKRGTR
jgi:hypothetical protein